MFQNVVFDKLKMIVYCRKKVNYFTKTEKLTLNIEKKYFIIYEIIHDAYIII